MAKAKASPSWPQEMYSAKASALKKNFTASEIRQEYSKLRDIAEKRIKRLGEKYPQSETYQYYADRFKPLSEIAPNKQEITSELAASLKELSQFVSSKRSTVSGQKAIRKQTIATMHEHGYTWINEANFDDFTDFMEEMRASHQKDIYSSERIVELYKIAQSKQIPSDVLKENMDFYVKNRKSLSQVQYEEGMTSKDLTLAIRKYNTIKKVK